MFLTLFWSIKNSSTRPVSQPSLTQHQSFMDQGIEAMHNQNFTVAVEYFSRSLEKSDNHQNAYNNRCLAYLKLGAYENAIADCNQAINLNPNNSEAYLNRGISYYQMGDYLQAIENANQVLSKHPGDFRAYYNRGLAIAAQGNYPQAITDYNRALVSFAPDSTHDQSNLADIYNDLGLAEFQLHNFNTAIDRFSFAIQIYPLHEFAHFNRGCTCGKRADYRGAIRDFSHTVRINPSNTNAYINRGIAYHQLGYESTAMLDLQTAATQFQHQGNHIAYQYTLDLIKLVQKQMVSTSEFA